MKMMILSLISNGDAYCNSESIVTFFLINLKMSILGWFESGSKYCSYIVVRNNVSFKLEQVSPPFTSPN